MVAAGAQPRARQTVIGTNFQVDTAFDAVLDKFIVRLRGQLLEQRNAGKLIGFVSLPLSSRGGGNRDLNVEISEHIKRKLEARLGGDRVYVLAPGLVESSLPDVEGRSAQGGEYMYMWTEVLAGKRGLAEDFDFVYFAGPTDFADYFALTGTNDLGKLEQFMFERLKSNPEFAESLKSPADKRAFLSYYGLKASVNFSSGSHDEWNLFRIANERRRKEWGVGEQLPLYFDGRQLSPGEAEAPASKGYQI